MAGLGAVWALGWSFRVGHSRGVSWTLLPPVWAACLDTCEHGQVAAPCLVWTLSLLHLTWALRLWKELSELSLCSAV